MRRWVCASMIMVLLACLSYGGNAEGWGFFSSGADGENEADSRREQIETRATYTGRIEVKQEVDMLINCEAQLRPIVVPDKTFDMINAPKAELDYSSSNESVARVNSQGSITAVGEGEATIAIDDENYGHAECLVRVQDRSPVYSAVIFSHVDAGFRATHNFWCEYILPRTQYAARTYPFPSFTRKQFDDQFRTMEGWNESLRLTPYDVTFIYMNTHGSEYEEYPGIGVGFLTSDRQCITYSEMKNRLTKIKGQKIVFLDSCYAGGMIESGSLTLGASSDNQDFLVEYGPRVMPDSGIYMMGASSKNGTSRVGNESSGDTPSLFSILMWYDLNAGAGNEASYFSDLVSSGRSLYLTDLYEFANHNLNSEGFKRVPTDYDSELFMWPEGSDILVFQFGGEDSGKGEENDSSFANNDEADLTLFTFSEPIDGAVTVTGLVDKNACPDTIVIPRRTVDNYTVAGISDEAFKECDELLCVSIPESVTAIGDWAFHYCTNLKEVRGASRVGRIGAGAFWGCGALEEISLPERLESIGAGAFYGCGSLADLTIPDGVTIIEDYAFYDCFSLEHVDLPNNLTSIENNAFGNCTSLAEIELPESVKSIWDGAFGNCGHNMVFVVKRRSYADTWAQQKDFRTRYVILDDFEPVQLFLTQELTEYGATDEKLMLGLFDASGNLLNQYPLGCISQEMREHGGAMGATVWRLSEDMYYVEAFGGFESLAVAYEILQIDLAIRLVAGASDPGPTDMTYIGDIKTGEALFIDEVGWPADNYQNIILTLNNHFSDYGFDFGERRINAGGHFGMTSYTSACIQDDMIVDELIGWDESRVILTSHADSAIVEDDGDDDYSDPGGYEYWASIMQTEYADYDVEFGYCTESVDALVSLDDMDLFYYTVPSGAPVVIWGYETDDNGKQWCHISYKEEASYVPAEYIVVQSATDISAMN